MLRSLYAQERGPVPIVQETDWVPGPAWTCEKNLVPTSIEYPDRSACSKSLHRLCCTRTSRISYVILKVTHTVICSTQRMAGDYRNPSLDVFLGKPLPQAPSRDISLLYEKRVKGSVPQSFQLNPSLCRQNTFYTFVPTFLKTGSLYVSS